MGAAWVAQPLEQDPSMPGWPELPPPANRKRVAGNQEPPEVFGEGRFLQQLEAWNQH